MRHIKFLVSLAFALLFILGMAGVVFTTDKLEKMEQIRGWKPGATLRMEVVRQKLADRGAFWVALTEESIHRPGPHRMNLQPEAWHPLRVGDPIEIVYLPDSPEPYTRDGIFASDGNFAFDRGLLVFEYGMVGVSIVGRILTIGVFAFLGRRRRVAHAHGQLEHP